MESIELTAKSLEEAKTLAAAQLGVSADEVTVEVLEETKGLFGKTNLRVKATAGSASAPAAEKPKGRAPKAKATSAPAPEVKEEAAPAAEAEAKPARGGRGRAAAPKKEAAPATEAPAAESDEDEAPTAEYVATQEDAELLMNTTNGILEIGEINARVEISSKNGRYVNLKLDGKDSGYLVGKHGEVLNSLQYLLNVIGGKTLKTQARATLDGNDYRQRREEALSKYAASIAEQVIENGMEAVLDALPAFERRIVHKALQEIDGISTYSEGEEPNRRVVIAPL